MKKKEFKPEQIITMLREAEVVLAQGSTAVEVVRKLGITSRYTTAGEESTEGCVLKIERPFVANLSLDNAILKEAARRNS